MRTLSNARDRNELLQRLTNVRPDNQAIWGVMSVHQMICHLSDSFRAALGEKEVNSSTGLFRRTLLKWAALWFPAPWPHGFKTRPEMDQRQGGTPPIEFASDVETLRNLFARFCAFEGKFVPHAILGPMSRAERMRHAYLHIDHHLRQFGA